MHRSAVWILLVPAMLFLIVLPPVLSLQDYWTNIHPGWSHLYLYVTGVMSAVIGVVFLLRHRIWGLYKDNTGEYDSVSNGRGLAGKSRTRNGISRKGSEVKYPDVYYTATRPASVNIKPMLRLSNEIQSFVERIDKYTDHLEQILQEKATALSKNKNQLNQLLGQLLPPTVALQFSLGQRVEPATFECVTVYFSDIVGYTTITEQSSALEMVEFLNTIYRMADRIVERYDAYKMETIGDADLIASGIPVPNGDKHATELAGFALDMIDAYKGFYLPHRPSETAQIRIGMHSGKCMAGVVGSRVPKYCLFGEAVSTAAKLEATSEPSKIHLSPTTAEIILKAGGFSLEKRGPVKFKNGKTAETYWLLGRSGANSE